MSLLVALLSKLLTDELKAWCPALTQYVIEKAISMLPESEQARFSEEWQSHIEETPGNISKFFVALSFVVASRRINSLLTRNAEDQFVLYEIVRSLADLILSVLAIVWLAPLFPLIAIAIRIGCRQAAITRVRCVGRNGREFDVLEFGGSGRIGEFLERTGLSNLPILINILKGDMSFVGPRPPSVRIAAMLSADLPDHWQKRIRVRPGLFSPMLSTLLEEEQRYLENRTWQADLALVWNGVKRGLLGGHAQR